MKKITFILSFFILLFNCSKDQEPEVIYDGSIWFKTQQQVDDFGKEGYTKILGNVKIDDYESDPNSLITNLNSLSTLKFIDGSLGISRTTALTSLDGLNNLASIRYLGIIATNNLANIDGLENVSSDLEALTISENNSLETINGLKNISTINGGLRIKFNPKLKNIDGLISLTSVNEKISIHYTNLTALNGLANLSSHIESLSIIRNPKLKSLSGLDNIPSVERYLEVRDNEVLNDLCGVKTIVNYIIENDNKNANTNSYPIIGYYAENNAYNPTKQDFIDGNCSN